VAIPVFIAGAIGGGWLVRGYKDRFIAWYQGGEVFAKKLEAQAAVLQAKAAAVRAAIK